MQVQQNQPHKVVEELNFNGYAFRITQQILQKTNLTFQQIQNTLKNGVFQKKLSNENKQTFDTNSIMLMCLYKDNNKHVTFSNRQIIKLRFLSQYIQQFRQTNMQCSFLICNVLQSRFDNNLFKGQNQINNLQNLQFLKAQNLITFQLFRNNIVRIGSFYKNNYLKSVENLTLYENKIKQISLFNRGMFQNAYYMEIEPFQTGDTSIEDLVCFMKFQCQKKRSLKNKFFWCSSSQRIQQLKILELNNNNCIFG